MEHRGRWQPRLRSLASVRNPQYQILVSRDIGQYLLPTIGPSGYQGIHAGGCTQAEVQQRRHRRLETPGQLLLQGLLLAGCKNGYGGPNPLCVLAGALQLYLQIMMARLALCLVAIDKGGLVDIIDHQIQIAIVIQIGISGAVAVRRLCDAPVLGFIDKRLSGLVGKNIVGNVGSRHMLNNLQHILPLQPTFRLHDSVHIIDEIEVRIVAVIAVSDEKVFPAVVIIVGQQGGPAPIGVRHTRQLTDFAERAVAIVELEHIAHVLVMKTAAHVEVMLGVVVGAQQEFLTAVVLRQHIKGHDVGPAVIIYVRDVITHRKLAVVAHALA